VIIDLTKTMEVVFTKVGLAYNLPRGTRPDVEDWEAEYDSMEVVMDIKKSIESGGHEVVLMEAVPEKFIPALTSEKVDIVYNFAEGTYSRAREAQVPAILSFYNIPYTGSDATTLAVCLDKALTKQILLTKDIKTPRFQVIRSPQEKLRKNMRFPLILKLNAEGSSKGISETGLVHNYDEYKKEIDRLFSIYSEPVLVEEFIRGREFTIGVLQEGNKYHVLPIMEIHFKHGKEFYSYKVKKNSDYYVDYTCPAKIDLMLERKLKNMAVKICKTLEIKDVARMDLRVSQEDNNPYFLEINPLPGMARGFSDLPRIAEVADLTYEELVLHVLENAVKRSGLVQDASLVQWG